MIDQSTPAQEATKREMYRVSLDDCMVFNPTDEDFVIDWDGFKHIVPNQHKDLGWGKGRREVKRYLAIWYCRHMKDKLVNEMGEKKAAEMLSKRQESGKEAYTDKYVENREIWDKVPKSNDPKVIGDIYPLLFLGVVREFGNEFDEEERRANVDTRSQEEKVMEELQKRKFIPEAPQQPEGRTSPDAPQAPLNTKKDKLVKEVTA